MHRHEILFADIIEAIEFCRKHIDSEGWTIVPGFLGATVILAREEDSVMFCAGNEEIFGAVARREKAIQIVVQPGAMYQAQCYQGQLQQLSAPGIGPSGGIGAHNSPSPYQGGNRCKGG